MKDSNQKSFTKKVGFKKSKPDRGIEYNEKAITLNKLVPSFVTLLSLCVGLNAIKLAINGEHMKAAAFLLVAGFFDGIDGRLARFFSAESDFGAQLDSLVDFVNFGVAPAFIFYSWVTFYAEYNAASWAVGMLYVVCSAIRLARFNSEIDKSKDNILYKYFFKGIPAPAGATLSMLPMIAFYKFGSGIYSMPLFTINFFAIIAVLMASRVPTISIKKIPIRNDYTNLTILLSSIIIIGLFIKPWFTVIFLSTLYFLSIPVTVFVYIKISSNQKTKKL